MAWYKCGSRGTDKRQELLPKRVSGSVSTITSSSHDGNYLDWCAFSGRTPSNLRQPEAYTCWSAGQNETNAWIKVDLGSSKELAVVQLDVFSNYSGDWVGDINIQGSNDNSTWVDILKNGQSSIEITAPLQQIVSIYLDVIGSYRYVRIVGLDAFTVYYHPSCFFDEIFIYTDVSGSTSNSYTNYDYYETTQQIIDLSNFTKLYNTSVAFGSNGTKVDTALGLTDESTITANMLAGWDSTNSCYYNSENQIGAYGGYDFGQALYISSIKLWLGRYVNQNKDLPVVVQYLDSNNTWQDYKKFDIDAAVEYPYHVLDISFEFSCYGIRWIHNEVTKTSGNNITFFGMTLYQPNTLAKRVYKLTQLSATVPQGYSGFGNLLIGTPKTYIKFNGQGIVLPWTLNSDYRIEVVFYEHYFRANGTIIGNTNNNGNYSHITPYSNKYYTSTGTGETNFGTWAAGEHTFVNNDGNGHNVFDGVEVTSYTPTTNTSLRYTIGCRTNAGSNVYYGLIKSYKIYSLTTLNLIHDFRPCEVLGMACFYDAIDSTYYQVPDGQALDGVF